MVQKFKTILDKFFSSWSARITMIGIILGGLIYSIKLTIDVNNWWRTNKTMVYQVGVIYKSSQSIPLEFERLNKAHTAIEHKQAFLDATQNIILDKMQLATFETDKNGYTTSVSRYMITLTQRPFEDIKGIEWTDYIVINPNRHLSDKKTVMANFDDCVRRDKDFKDVFSMVCPDSSIIDVRALAYKVAIGGYRIGYKGYLQKL